MNETSYSAEDAVPEKSGGINRSRDSSIAVQGSSTAGTTGTAPWEAPRKKERYVKASARFVSTPSRFGFGRSRAARAATPSDSLSAQGTRFSGDRTTARGEVARLAGVSSGRARPTGPDNEERYVRSKATAATGDSTNREKGPFSLGVIAAMFVCAAALLGIGAPVASAATADTSYGLTGEIGTPDTYFPQSGQQYLATTTGGDVFLLRGVDNTVDIIDSNGALVTRVNLATISNEPTGIAVAGDGSSLFVIDGGAVAYFGPPYIQKYVSDGAPTPTYTRDTAWAPSLPSGQNGHPGTLAIDPSTGDLLTDSADILYRLDPDSGAVVSTVEMQPGSGSPGLAAAPNGDVYYFANETRINHLGPGGSLKGVILLPASHAASFPVSLAVNPSNGDLATAVIDDGRPTIRFYTAADEFKDAIPLPEGATLSHGLAFSSDGNTLYLSNDNGTARVFRQGVRAGVDPPSISGISTNSLHVSTEVDPGEKEGGGVPDGSAVRFEYRAAGAETWIATPDQDVNAKATYETDLTGLDPNQTYEVRAVATNTLISHPSGVVQATTLPIIPGAETNAATDVTETTAVMNGTINSFGAATTYHFEYGTSAAYGSRAPTGVDATAGNARTPRRVSRKLTGLTPGTTYHFRLVATNAAGTVEGLDQTFTTDPAGLPIRAYEQVTPVDKQGRSVTPGLAYQAEGDGDGLSYTTKAGPETSPAFTRFVSIRSGSDWQAGIPTDPQQGGQSTVLLSATTLAVSPDFSHAFVVSNLAPGGIEGGANLYVKDLASGDLQFVGASNQPGAYAGFVGPPNGEKFQVGAPDFSWVVFPSPVPLLPGAPPNALYRWSEDAGLEALSILPSGEIARVLQRGPEYHNVSKNGQRVYFSAVNGPEEGIYLRENGGPSQAISVSHIAGDPDAVVPATLLGVNEDGRYAFFVCSQRLTPDAPGEPNDLYRYDAADGSLEYLHAQAKARSLGISPDGNTFYFVDLPGASSASVWHNGEVHVAFPQEWQTGDPNEYMSPDGRYFAKPEVVEGVPNVVELYDAETNQLVCASCLADGTPISAALATHTAEDVSNHNPQSVDNSGTVYFDTTGRLVAGDVNGTRDVYAFRDDEASLISPGNAPFEAQLADISEDGEDVFFTTGQKLVGRDNDESIDVYDARVNGGLPAQSPPPSQECLRDDCKSTPGAGPELPFGGSEALSGPGNLKSTKKKARTCGKGKRKAKVKVRCVKKHETHKSRKGGNR
jgi:hypothetical protein